MAEQEDKEKMEVKNTDTFLKALENGDLAVAEDFLNDVASHPERYPNYDARWRDHRGRELFQAFYKREDWTGAKRVVEATEKPLSKEGRKKRLEELSGMKYEDINI